MSIKTTKGIMVDGKVNYNGTTLPIKEMYLQKDGNKHLIFSGQFKLPPARNLKFGNKLKGYYGALNSKDFITYDALAKELGFTRNIFISDTWQEYSINFQRVFKTTSPICNNISWQELDDLGMVTAEKEITLGTSRFKVHLLNEEHLIIPTEENYTWSELVVPSFEKGYVTLDEMGLTKNNRHGYCIKQLTRDGNRYNFNNIFTRGTENNINGWNNQVPKTQKSNDIGWSPMLLYVGEISD